MSELISRSAWPIRRLVGEFWSLEMRTKHREGVMRITWAYTAETVDDWVQRVKARVLGFDIEYKPTFERGCKQNRASVLQLAAGDEVLVVQLFALGGFPAGLCSLMENERVIKVGVGVNGDVQKLKADWDVVVNGAVDLSSVMQECHGEETYLSLAKLASKLLGIDMCKNKKVVLSNWEKPKLTRDQVVYAALDAWVGSECAAASR